MNENGLPGEYQDYIAAWWDSYQGRGFTTTELEIIKTLCQACVDSYAEAWSQVN